MPRHENIFLAKFVVGYPTLIFFPKSTNITIISCFTVLLRCPSLVEKCTQLWHAIRTNILWNFNNQNQCWLERSCAHERCASAGGRSGHQSWHHSFFLLLPFTYFLRSACAWTLCLHFSGWTAGGVHALWVSEDPPRHMHIMYLAQVLRVMLRLHNNKSSLLTNWVKNVNLQNIRLKKLRMPGWVLEMVSQNRRL